MGQGWWAGGYLWWACPRNPLGSCFAGASVELVGKLMGAGQTPGRAGKLPVGKELGGKPVRIPEEPNQEAACWVPWEGTPLVSHANRAPRSQRKEVRNYEERCPPSQHPPQPLLDKLHIVPAGKLARSRLSRAVELGFGKLWKRIHVVFSRHHSFFLQGPQPPLQSGSLPVS